MKIKMWRQLEHGVDEAGEFGSTLDGLQAISLDKLGTSIPELSLWLSVLIDAGKHRDHEFINTMGRKICQMAKLDFNYVTNAFETIWREEDANCQEQ